MNAPHYSEIETRQQIKTFAHTLDATSYILRRLNFPVHKLRDVVDGLQGAGGGRAEFDLSHLALARRLRHTGSDETAATYAQRKVAALRKAQLAAGRLLFTFDSEIVITKENKVRRTPMHYVDHLTPAANWMMQQARASDLWKEHPARAIEAFTDEAIKMLPAVTPEGKPEAGTMPLDDELYIQRMIKQSINCALKACDRAARNGGDDLAVAQMAAETLLRYVGQRHRERRRRTAPNLQKCRFGKTLGKSKNPPQSWVLPKAPRVSRTWSRKPSIMCSGMMCRSSPSPSPKRP